MKLIQVLLAATALSQPNYSLLEARRIARLAPFNCSNTDSYSTVMQKFVKGAVSDNPGLLKQQLTSICYQLLKPLAICDINIDTNCTLIKSKAANAGIVLSFNVSEENEFFVPLQAGMALACANTLKRRYCR